MTVNSRHVFAQLKSKVEMDSGSAKVKGPWPRSNSLAQFL